VSLFDLSSPPSGASYAPAVAPPVREVQPREASAGQDHAPPSPPKPVAPPVRVCFLIDQLGRAGTESQLLALIRTADRSRIAPTLVLLDGESAESRALEPADCPVLRLGLKRLFGRSAIRAARRLRDFWRDHPADVVQTYFLDSSYFGAPVAKWAGVRRVVRVRNNLGYWLTRKHRLLGKLTNRYVDVMLTNTDAGRDALVQREGHDPDRVVVMPNGVDFGRFDDCPPPYQNPQQVTVGCVANLRPVKNIDGLVRAARWARLRAPNLRFEVAGDGDQRAELEKLRDDLNLGDRFVFRGSVADVPAFLKSVDVAVLPSHSEGMSNAVLEAMAAGRPLVVTDVGANRTLVRDGVDGLVVPPGEERPLVDALVRLAEDPPLGRRMGGAGRARAQAEFSRDAMRVRFEEFYAKLLAEPGQVGRSNSTGM
jgi:glycosyltransferase involved in cell wall biosynthesis